MDNDEYPVAKFVRLQNGDDIVAETIEIEDEDGILYMLINPLKVVYMQSQHDGYLSVSFIPWVFTKICDHQEFTIHAQDVLMVTNVSQKMNDYYWSNLGPLIQKMEEPPEEKQPEPDENDLIDALNELAHKRIYH